MADLTDKDRAISCVSNEATLISFKRVKEKRFSNYSYKMEDKEVLEVIFEKNGKQYRTTTGIGGNYVRTSI